MSAVLLPAHYDGKEIILDKPFPLELNAKLLVTVLPSKDAEHEDWVRFSMANLAAYGDDEPEYGPSDIIEANPHYTEALL